MKHNGIIAIVFVVGCATGGVAAQLGVPPVRAGAAPTRWEYHCATMETERGEEMTPNLNKFGAQGWELASMAPAATMGAFLGGDVVYKYTLCVKRALP